MKKVTTEGCKLDTDVLFKMEKIIQRTENAREKKRRPNIVNSTEYD